MVSSSIIRTHLKIHMYMMFSFIFDLLYNSSTRRILERNKLACIGIFMQLGVLTLDPVMPIIN